MTASWQRCVQWKDGSASWESLSGLKELHLIECAEYAVAQNLQAGSVFNCWVSYVSKKRERIIPLIKKRNSRCLKRNENCGIDLHKTVEEVKRLDKKIGNNMSADAIATEMANVKVASSYWMMVSARHEIISL